MKTFDKCAAQGDVLFVRVAELPEGVKLTKDTAAEPIVAHSETGHHHVLRKNKPGVEVERLIQDELTSYIRIRVKRDELVGQADQALAGIDEALASNVPARVDHLRSYDTHETLGFVMPEGCDEVIYKALRQEEKTPQGWITARD